MKKILAFLLSLYWISSSAQLTYEKIYSSSALGDYCTDLIIAHDGNYIITGNSNVTTSSYFDVRLCKLSPAGNILWNYVYASPLSDAPATVKELSDSGFIIGMATNSFSSGLQEPGLIKTDSAGNLLWSKIYPVTTNYYDYASDVIETADHGFALFGSGNDSLPDGMIIKTDSAGNLEWKKYYHGSHIDNFFSGAQLSNGDIIAVGRTRSFPGPVYKIILTRVDTAGNVKWNRVYAASSNETGVKIISVNDSAIVIGGHTTAHAFGLSDLFIMVVDTGGAFQWGKAYGGINTEFFFNGSRTPDNGFLLCGSTNSFLFGGLEDVYAVRADFTGNLIWDKHYGSVGNERALSIQSTPGNGSILGCISSSFSQYAIYLIKTDSVGDSYCHAGVAFTVATSYTTSDSLVSFNVITGGTKTDVIFTTASGLNVTPLCSNEIEEHAEGEALISLFPNPFHSSSTITVNSAERFTDLQFFVYDATGREVRTIKLQSGATNLERENLLPGIYFYQVVSKEKQIATGKFAID